MTLERRLESLAVAYLGLLVAMTLFVAWGTYFETPQIRRLGFVFASLLPFALAPLTLAIGEVGRQWRGASVHAGVFMAAYMALSAAAYATQYLVVPRLTVRWPQMARLLDFDTPGSLTLSMDLLAYAFWGVGAIVATRHLFGRSDPWRLAGWSLGASGLTSVVAFGLHALGWPAGEMISVVSGALTIPAAGVALLVAPGGSSTEGPGGGTGKRGGGTGSGEPGTGKSGEEGA